MVRAGDDTTARPDVPITLVSADSHVGPLLVEQLREYCPQRYLGEFDEYVSSWQAQLHADSNVPEQIVDVFVAGVGVANLDSPGHHDMDARLEELDADGVAAEVIFHASENGQPIPFRPLTAHFGHGADENPELAAVGNRIYNRWLADACSIQPERHAGLVYLELSDVDAAVDELRWARNAGLRGVNFPAMRANLPPYNDAVWEPLWDACEDLEMPLTTHIGGASPAAFGGGPEGLALKMLEDSHVFGYRGVHWMIFGGVFERHPRLKLVITEIAGDWFANYLKMLDDVWWGSLGYPGFRERVPRPASEYCMTNVYFGASFMANFEAAAAVRDDYVDRVMWGSDYPHVEGTWQRGFELNGETATHLALRNTFAGIPEPSVRSMAGETAIDVYGFDRAALERVAARIASHTPRELATPPEEIPKGLSTLAFRKRGTWT